MKDYAIILILITAIFLQGCADTARQPETSSDTLDSLSVSPPTEEGSPIEEWTVDEGTEEQEYTNGRGPASIPGIADTVISSPPDTVKAELAYKYPGSIKQNEVKDVWVYVKVRSTPNAVVAELKNKIENYEHIVDSEDTINIYTTEIGLYENLTVILEDPAKDFIITKLHTQDRQVVDLNKGNQWHWVIQTKTDKNKAVLIINAITDNADGSNPNVVNTKQIPIKITLEKAWFRKLYTWLINNPEYVIGSLLVPFIIFIGRRVLTRRSKN